MIAHERALEWQELFDVSIRENVSREEVIEIAYRISGLFLGGVSTCPTYAILQRSFCQRSVILKRHESLSITPEMFGRQSLLSSRAMNSQRRGGL